MISAQRGWIASVLFAALMAPGCSTDIVRQVGLNSEPPFQITRVYFATDRERSKTSESDHYSDRRGNVSYGVALVSIPRDHKMGVLERPSLYRLEFREDAIKHITLRSIEQATKVEVFNQMASRIKQSERRSALIYVHGYNVSFDDAAMRTGQMAYDLAFDGPVAFYSWPSRAKFASYTVDEQSVAWSQKNLESFIVDFAKLSTAENIYLIAHSMGARALTAAYVSAMEGNPDLRSRFREIILAAPDIDSDVFVRDIAPAMTKLQSSTTLYASSNDAALKASRSVHGAPRAGDSGSRLVVHKGIETIDASSVETNLIGHSYYAENKTVVADIFHLVRNGLRAKDRSSLLLQTRGSSEYWEFRR